MQSSHSGDSAWKTSCCSQSNASSKLGTNFAAACCDPSTNNDTGKVIGTTTLNQAACCMKYTPGKSCCGAEGKKWNNTDLGACCTFTTANDACCKAYKDNGYKKNDGTKLPYNNAFVVACCNLNASYCENCEARSYANSSRWNLPSCCFDSKMQSGHSGESTWKNSCCSQSNAASKLGSNYKNTCCNPSSNNDTGAIYGTSTLNQAACCMKYTPGKTCCAGEGKKWDNTDLADCCSYNTSNPTDKCCFFANAGANSDWGTKEGYHKACCNKVSENYCSCQMRYDSSSLTIEPKSASGVTGETAGCCEFLRSKYYRDNGKWNNECCKNYVNNQFSGFSSVCCEGSYDGRVRGTDKKTSACCNVAAYANEYCCDATSTWLGTACCKGNNKDNNGKTYNGSANTSKCCDYSGAANETCCKAMNDNAGGPNATWTNETFHNSCCDLNDKYCSCQQKYDKGKSIDATCCSELKSKVSQSKWQSQCCKHYIGNENKLGGNNFAYYCCDGDGVGTVTGAGNSASGNSGKSSVCCNGYTIDDDFCCDHDNNQCSCEKRLQKGLSLSASCCQELRNNPEAMKKCCASGGAFANSASFSSYCCANTQGTSKTGSFDQRCCSGTSEACCRKNCAYCSCEMKWSINNSCFNPSSDCPCSKKFSSDTSWKEQCCGPTSSDNYAGFTTGTSYSGDVSKWASTCCTSDWNGTYYGGPESGEGEGDVKCCSTSSPSTWCCKQNKKYCGTCSDTEITNYPDSFDTSCCNSYKSKHGSKNYWLKRCCPLQDKSDKGACCGYDPQYCTCIGKYDYYGDVTGCCSGNGKLTGDRWVNGCCNASTLNSADGRTSYANPNGDFAKCCKKLYNSGDKSQFYENSDCCKALGDTTGSTYSECKPVPQPCNSTANYTKNAVYYNADAKACCNSRTQLFATGSVWQDYCCLLKSSNYSDTFAISPSNTSCCNKRQSSTGVYAYVPSYVSKTCNFKGEAFKCSSFQFASESFRQSYGFYCGPISACMEFYNTGNYSAATEQYIKYRGNYAYDAGTCCLGLANNYDQRTNIYNNGTMKAACCAQSTFANDPSNSSFCDDECTAWLKNSSSYAQFVGSDSEKLACCNDHWNDKSSYGTYKTKCCGISSFKTAHTGCNGYCVNTGCGGPTPTYCKQYNDSDCKKNYGDKYRSYCWHDSSSPYSSEECCDCYNSCTQTIVYNNGIPSVRQKSSSCNGGMTFNENHCSCECPSGTSWDSEQNSCRYPSSGTGEGGWGNCVDQRVNLMAEFKSGYADECHDQDGHCYCCGQLYNHNQSGNNYGCVKVW